MSDVFLNGTILGEVEDKKKLINEIKRKRRGGVIPSELNIHYKEKEDEIIINTDGGRVRRPLIVVENGEPKLKEEHLKKLENGELTWDNLVNKGIVEYLDSEEEEDALVAFWKNDLTEEHTHLEINPACMLGLSASLIPYAQYNRGDRVNFGAKMTGQALGYYTSNFPTRSDTKSNLLFYSQSPLVTTETYPILGLESHPSGQNVVIAVLSYKGYNMEDAIVVNKNSIERGFGLSYFFRTYQTEEMRYWGGQEDEIKIPEKDVRGYRTEKAYSHLAEDGIIPPETDVGSGDVLVGKISPLRFMGREEFRTGIQNKRETSLTVRHGEKGTVDKVFITETQDGNRSVKVTLRDLRKPELGDKFASRHGQKGVIGLIVPEEDMPFTQNGITPDIILNPHSIPSRLTVGQLLEALSGKVGALSGRKIDGTIFNEEKEGDLREKLKELGFSNDGKEVLYNGITGEKMEVEIFVGMMYYQKLEHMVANKIHARSRGPVALLTKQPTEGRAKEGGLRLGEMEKDCLIGHGASLLLKERFSSDEVEVNVCKKCGMLGVKDYTENKLYCSLCKDSEIGKVEMSYSFKLLLDELKSMMIFPKLKLTEKTPPKIDKISFGILSPGEVEDLSVAEITRPELYDRDGYPVENGVMDPRMGVIDPGMRCRTCGGTVGTCPGHFGKIELARPVINVRYSKTIYKLLRATCEKCYKPLMKEGEEKELDDPLYKLYLAKRKKCPICGAKQRKIKLDKPHTFLADGEALTPVEIREWLENIRDEDLEFFGLGGGKPEWLVITMLPVPPVTMRPSITLESGERSEDDLTHKLVDIIRINKRLRDNIDIGAPEFIIQDLWELLQYHVSTFFNNSLSGVPQARHRSGRALKTLTQRLKGKQGRFRGNLSGKRVNFSSRTVISPDPNLGINEVGVPSQIAKELTIPIEVNERNLSKVKRIVERGPNSLEGGNYLIRPDGKKKKITEENKGKIKEEVEPGFKVERHLKDGDIVLFNRQPSLHRMSLMGHRVKVMPWKTFRLNLCDCPPYNADFDGDEMNLHVPQTEEARTEAEELMLVQEHIRSPRYGGPIVGCIQDHISGNYLLTEKERKFSKEEATQLLNKIGIEEDIEDRISGKELFSYLLPRKLNISFKSSSCRGCETCKEEECPYDEYVKIKNGKLKMGVIDKNAIGRDDGILLGAIEREFGSEEAKDFLNRVSRLGIKFLDKRGFTIGVSEMDIPTEARDRINKTIQNARKRSQELVEKFEKEELEQLPGQTLKETLETKIMKSLQNALTKTEEIISESIPENHSTIMARSGARGSTVNLAQLAGFVGLETLQGEMIHRGYKDRTLPNFKKGDLSPKAHGFVTSSFKQGLNPFEFFFDAMNGREGLMDKSLRTRHSGYMERRLVNALQDLKIEYDGTIRDNRRRIIQFVPGEDFIDPAKSSWGSLNIEDIVKSVTS